MRYKKSFVILSMCLLIGLLGCARDDQKAEAPKREYITKNLVPAKAEVEGQSFSAEISDLKVSMNVDIASKEIVDTPILAGHIKVTNKSKDIIDIQAVTLEYLDLAGKPIAFKTGEKISKVTSYWLKIIKPGDTVEGSIDATIPRAAVKEKILGSIEVNLVYVPSPLKRETLTFPEKME